MLFLFCTALFATFTYSHGSPKLLFANHYNICTLDLTLNRNNVTVNRNNVTLVVTGLKDVAAMDFMYEDQMVYWTDITRGKIRGVRLNGSLNTVDVLSNGIISPEGLACDWATKKLYWVDSETNRIEVCNLNGTFRKVLVWQELDLPRALVLDPRQGYMYWTDWGETAKIERMAMDGNDKTREILVNSDIYWPNGLTLDYDENRLFWTDSRLHYIHSSNLDGSDRQAVIHNSLPHPFAITVYENAIYWTDWHQRAIFTSDKLDGHNQRMVVDKLYVSMDIHVMESRRQPKVTSPCQEKNGGCSHLCLLSPLPPYYSCQCPTGIRLLQDNRTCDQGPNEMLLLVRRTDIRLISLDTPDLTDQTLEIGDIHNAITLDYDPVEKMVYWTDDQLHVIRRSSLDGSVVETIVDVEVRHPDGIAVDWIARNLYWTDAGTDRIQVSRLNGSSRKVVISDGLQEPRAIVLDPVSGQMYWSDWGNDTKIERANLDGSGRIPLVNTSVGWPNGLAIDHEQKKLYWADAKLDCIEYINLDGTGRRILLAENLPHIFGFTLLGDYIYWTDWQRRAIESVHKSNGMQRMVIIEQLPDVMGLKAVNVSFREGENDCSRDNGGCSHLCLYRPHGATCACPFGMELSDSDEKTCIVPKAFVVYSTSNKLHAVSLDGTDKVQDISLKGFRNFKDIAYGISDGRIYWIDAANKAIARAFLNGSSIQVLITNGLDLPERLAIDHLAENLYWADYGTGRIEMARCDGTLRRMLIWKDNKPQALTVIPSRGYMFWTNVANTPCLERATLDGSNRMVIVSDLAHVASLTSDPKDDRLYWTNNDRGSIESSDLNGQSRQTVISRQTQAFGLTQHGDFLYWMDRQWHEIVRADKHTGENRSRILSTVTYPSAMVIFYTTSYSGWSSCSTENGGCKHLCITDVRHSDAVPMSHHCICASHFTLAEDNRSCEASDPLLLLSQKNSILQLSVGELTDSTDILLPIPAQTMRDIQAIDFNPADNFIYWIDGKTKSIRKIQANGSDMVILLQNLPPHHSFICPYDVVLSPQDALLYWSDSSRDIISGMKLDGSEIGVIVNDSSQKPRRLAVAPENGLIFWTNMAAEQQSIESAGADGRGQRTILRSSGLLGPIVADEELRRIYWADLKTDTIESGNFDGSNRSILINSVSEPVALAIHGEHLYWISKDTRTLERVNKRTGQSRRTLKTRLSHLSDLVITRRRQVKSSSRDPCSRRCSHFCIRDAVGEPRCACPKGLVLATDDKTCIKMQSCSEGHFSCKSESKLCIPLQWRCDGELDCSDGSDELNCTSCQHSEFRCKSGECIALDRHCNGQNDCADNSDEDYCPVCKESLLHCFNSRTCFLPAQRCDGTVNCWDGIDEVDCGDPHYSGTKLQHMMVIIGFVSGILVVVVAVTIVYMLRSKDRQCSKVYKDTSLVMVARNSESLMNDGKGMPVWNNVSPLLLPDQCQVNTLWSCDYVSDTCTLMSDFHQYPKQTLNPPPTPIASDDGSTTLNSTSFGSFSTLHVPKRPYRNQCRSIIKQLTTTPCSTDVCDDSDPVRGCDVQNCLSSSEWGFESDLDPPPPPTPCSQLPSDGCPPSPSTQRSLCLPILDMDPADKYVLHKL